MHPAEHYYLKWYKESIYFFASDIFIHTYMKSFTAMKGISTSCILKISMNVSRELVPFFSIKKPSSSSSTNEKDYKNIDENVSDFFPTTTYTTTAPVSYKIYSPVLNYYIGTYLAVIGKLLNFFGGHYV